MVDLDAMEAAGIAGARERAALLEYLDSLGFTAEEMVNAERNGRLFGLAGDALQRSGPPIHSLKTAADALGAPLADVQRAWATLGLDAAHPDDVICSRADVDALSTWVDMRALVGEEHALNLLRVVGATLERLAEAQSAFVRASWPSIQLGHTSDELATAKAYRAIAEFVPRTGAAIDALLRHHMRAARTHFEGVMRDTSANVVCGIGFADLSGFTALTQRLTTDELSLLLNAFNAAVNDVVHTDGGRIVKFIGDEVMWVAATPAQLVNVALDLVDHPGARDTGLGVRAGLAFGQVLAINGDYFGNPVNLAARLVAAAAPGQILVSTDVRDVLPDWPAIPREPLTLKGFDDPVTAYDLHVSG